MYSNACNHDGRMRRKTQQTPAQTVETAARQIRAAVTPQPQMRQLRLPKLQTSDASASDEGKVLNIYCWNEEFKSRVTDHYPGYTEVDATTGTIGDVTVKWNITPNDDNAYQNNLDATLLKQADAAADDKIDIFLVEADYALKYVDTDYTMAVSDLGITDSDLSKQYQYTKDVVTDSNGVLKRCFMAGLSWRIIL